MAGESTNLLKPGDSLGPYRIEALLGKGGMGEVYRGTDTRLGRPVAIKVSAREFSDRFEREAKAISSLNHPHVCTLYDVGPNYLVLEFVEGDTLAHLAKQGPMPLEQVLQYAIQIADALSAAHAKGIIHRDLKPANIILTANGVKVLDFGLAKLNALAKFSASSSSQMETRTEPMTESGSIIGTLNYMAPEQAEGKDTDERSDIFALGAVLYEMLTGRKAFDGETRTAVLAAILKDQPAPIQQFQPAIPRSFDRVVRKCLEKKPSERWHSAHDLKQTLELIDLSGPVGATAGTSASVSSASGIQAARPPSRAKWIWSAGAAVVILAAAGGWEWCQSNRFTDLPLIRQDVDLGQDIALSGPVQFVSNVMISPDGTRIAYVASPASGGGQRLYTRRLDQPMAVELPGTENPRGPFFSPDGRWLGFASMSARKLYKISVDGGAAVPLMDLRGLFGGASWGKNGIAVAQGGSPLVRIADNGAGQPKPLGPFAPGEVIQMSPQILPGGETALFAGNSGNEGGPPDPDRGSIEAISLADGHRKTILKGGAFPRYAGSSGGVGHILYTFRGALYALPFDPQKLEALGAAAPVLSDVMGGQNAASKFDVSNTGVLLYIKGESGPAALSTIEAIDAAGKSEPLLAKPGAYQSVRLSSDGKRMALAVRDGPNQNVQVYEWQTGRTTNLTFGGAVYADPIWRPDGQYVVFRATNGSMYWARADGSGQPQQLSASVATQPQIPWSFSPDGKTLAFFQPPSPGSNRQLWTMPIEEQGGQLHAGAKEQFLKSESYDFMPQFSPDGKWIAYRSALSGANQIYVRPASGKAGQWVVSASPAATSPVWSRAAHDLLYVTSDNQIMAAAYSVNGDTFIPDKPRVWLAKFAQEDFDLFPDGKRIAAIVPVQSASTAPPQSQHEVVFLQNFFDELRRRVPVGK